MLAVAVLGSLSEGVSIFSTNALSPTESTQVRKQACYACGVAETYYYTFSEL